MIPAAIAMAAAVSAAGSASKPPPELARGVAACGVEPGQVAVVWDKTSQSSVVVIRQHALSQGTMTCLAKVSSKYQANFAFLAPDFHIEGAAGK
jgi:hypothetical protein